MIILLCLSFCSFVSSASYCLHLNLPVHNSLSHLHTRTNTSNALKATHNNDSRDLHPPANSSSTQAPRSGHRFTHLSTGSDDIGTVPPLPSCVERRGRRTGPAGYMGRGDEQCRCSGILLKCDVYRDSGCVGGKQVEVALMLGREKDGRSRTHSHSPESHRIATAQPSGR